jgi:hypothetical protein
MENMTIQERINKARETVKYHGLYYLVSEAEGLLYKGKVVKAHKLLSKYGF